MNEDEKLLINYRLLIEQFENNYVKENFHNYKDYEHHRGYLINLESYEALKNKIKISPNKNCSASKIIENLNKLKSIEIKTSQYLINMILNKNKYIIINTKLWNIFGEPEKDNNNSQILYNIDKNLIIFSLDDKKQLKFNCWRYDNIIDDSFLEENNGIYYSQFKSNFEKIDKIYKQIYYYYNFEKELMIHLSKNEIIQKKDELGYLVDINWLKKWKEKVNYEEIKQKFSIIKDENKIKNQIIFFEENNKEILPQIITKSFETESKLKNYLENNSLALVSFAFGYNINENLNGEIFYYASRNNIKIKINSHEINMPANNNIITLRQNFIDKTHDKNNMFQIHLKVLINIFYYKEEIKLRINSKYNKDKNEKTEIYFLNRNAIKKYKIYYEYNLLCKLLLSQEMKSINYNNFNNYYNIIHNYIESSNRELLEQLEKKINSKKFSFETEDYNIDYKIYNQGYYKLFYLDDIEILNEEIISVLDQIGIIKKGMIMKGKYIAGDKKILFSFKKGNENYFQIDSFDTKNDKFIIEYIIEDKIGYIFDYFKQEGIDYFLSQLNDKNIIYNNVHIGNCYQITFNQASIVNEFPTPIPLDSNHKNEYEKNIIKLLLSYALFKNDVENKASGFQSLENNHKNEVQLDKYYLVNKKIISEFLNLFWDENISIMIHKYKLISSSSIDDNNLKLILQDKNMEQCLKTIKEKKDYFTLKIKDIDFFEIETSFIKENNDLFYYPKDLIFLDEDLFLKFLELLNLNINDNKKKELEIKLNFNFGNIVFKSDEIYFLKNKLYSGFVYSLDKTPSKHMNFNFDMILAFSDYISFIKNFNDVISLNIKQNSEILKTQFENQYKLKIHLMNKNSEKDEEKKLDKILSYLVELYIEFINMKMKIGSSGNDSSILTQLEEDYYAIDKTYINEFLQIIHFNEIKTILNNNKKNFLYFESKKKECLDEFKNLLNPDIKSKLMQLENSSNYEKLSNYESYKLKKSSLEGSNIVYYDNFYIINTKIKKILTELNKNIFSSLFEQIECSFDNKHIFIKFKVYISVCHSEQNENLIVDYLITPKNQNHIIYLFETIKKEGYIFIQKYSNSGQFDYKYKYSCNYLYVQGKIYNVSQRKSINNSIPKSKINEKLKKIILFLLQFQNNIKVSINSDNKLAEDVYLINPEILSNPCIVDIDNLMKNNKNILDLISKLDILKIWSYSTKLDEIISQINPDEIKKLEQKYKNLQFQGISPVSQKVSLKDKKDVIIFRTFIMLRKNIFDYISTELGLNNIPKVLYTKFKEGDIIISGQKDILFIGKIDENNYFSLKFILTYKSETYLTNDLKYIKASGIDQYLETRTVFNKELKDDSISPIFSINETIGIYYRINNPGLINYANVKDYSDYINSSNFQKTYTLYNFYEKLKEKKNSSYSQETDYYLINKKSMSKIRKLYKYKDIKATIEKINPNEISKGNQKKILLYILKFLPENIFENFIEGEIDIEKMNKNEMEPDIEPVYTNDMNKNGNPLAMIYKNFEIIEPDIAKSFFHIDRSYLDFSAKDNNLMKCILKDGKVMINYEKNCFGNNKDIVVIGTLNDDNNFINEYVLIYEQYYLTHINNLKNRNLNKYLSQIQFVNDSSPIVINQYVEIGKIIRLPSAPINDNNNGNYQIFDEEQISNNDIPYDNYGTKDFKTDIVGDYNRNKYDKTNYSYINEDEYNLDSKTNVTSIKQYFPYPPLIGLDNIGATCYMNATLQCLCNIEKFVDYFKYNPHLINTVKEDKDKSKLCSSFKLLIEKLWPDKENTTNITKSSFYSFSPFNTYESEGSFSTNKKNKSIPPEEFKKKISKMNPLFEGVAANDAKDLVQFLIMTLHDELNKAQKKIVNNAINNDQSNKQLMFQIFAQDFMTSNISMISDLFYGVNYNIIQCGNCGYQSFNYQTYFFLVFPLEEVRIFKSQNTFNYNYNCFNNNEVNIYDCFFYDQKINFMSGSNNMYCNFCRQTCNSSMRTFLSTGPEILIIILNRGQGIQFNVKINFLEEINLENFIEMKQTGCNYSLIGVITHLGESGMGGHFIAYCKNPISGQWHKYNDSIVSEVENFKSEVIDFAIPYLLFYQKKI